MEVQERIARKHYICTVCGQLILPKESYVYRKWAPWNLEEGEGWMVVRACRWCDEMYGKMVRRDRELDGVGWWKPEEDGWDCCEAEMRKWLKQVMDKNDPGSIERAVLEGMVALRLQYQKAREFLKQIKEKGPKKLVDILGNPGGS